MALLEDKHGNLGVPGGDLSAEPEKFNPDKERHAIVTSLIRLVGAGVIKAEGPYRIPGMGVQFRFPVPSEGIEMMLTHIGNDSEAGLAAEGDYIMEVVGPRARTMSTASLMPMETRIALTHLWSELYTGSRRMISTLRFTLDAMEEDAGLEDEPEEVPSTPADKARKKTL